MGRGHGSTARRIAYVLGTVAVIARTASSFGQAPPPGTAAAWEMLIRAPVPADAVPSLSVVSLSPRATQGTLGAGHTHPGPVFGYIVRGEVENQVQPDPPATYKTGQVFYEAPGRLHIVMRNTSETEPATVWAFLVGSRGGANPAITLLAETQVLSVRGHDASLRRLTLPAGTESAAPVPQPGIVAIVGGQVEVSGAGEPARTYAAGDVFARSPNRRVAFRNASGAAAQVLLYQVEGRQTPLTR